MAEGLVEDLVEQRGLPEATSVQARETLALLSRTGLELTEGTLEALLCDEGADTEIRSAAAWLAGVLGLEESRQSLERVGMSGPPLVRLEAIQALARLGGSETLLMEILRAGSANAERSLAASALGRLRCAAAVPVLTLILTDQREDPSLRAHAAEALGYIGDRSAVPELVRAAEEPDLEPRFWGVFALGQLRAAEAVPLLMRIREQDHRVVAHFGSVSDEADLALAEIGRVSRSGRENPE